MADGMNANNKSNVAETYSRACHWQHTRPRFKHMLLVQTATGAETSQRRPALTKHTNYYRYHYFRLTTVFTGESVPIQVSSTTYSELEELVRV